MSPNQPSTSPEILSGPFGSLLNDLHGVSTRDAFRQEHFEWIRNALRAYKNGGVTQPVTPTFGAAARGVNGGMFTDELLHWNQLASQFTHEVFERQPLGSVAPLLDTSGGDDGAWSVLLNRQERALRTHAPQMQALRDGGVTGVLGEAFHDFDEAAGFVKAAERTGMHDAIVSFEPTRQGLPNNALGIRSYDEVAGRLRDIARGRIGVAIGMNCGNADQILNLLEESSAGTFSAVYPNHEVIPHDEHGALFRRLADLNHQRTPPQEQEFQRLRAVYEVSERQLSRLVRLGGALNVQYLGLCCGTSPKDTAALAARVRESTLAGAPQSLPVA